MFLKIKEICIMKVLSSACQKRLTSVDVCFDMALIWHRLALTLVNVKINSMFTLSKNSIFVRDLLMNRLKHQEMS